MLSAHGSGTIERYAGKGGIEMALKKLPVGIENFEKIRTQGFYYVDKTGMIIDLLHNWGEVNLFTRPRRFGKSLNMNMLKTFFEVGCKKELFDGLKIAQEKELCEEYMGQYPVISISLKGVDALNYQAAREALKHIIGNEALRFQFLEQSGKLSHVEKGKYQALINMENGRHTMPDDVLIMSLQTLSELLAKHYEKKTIVLIDEYFGFTDDEVKELLKYYGLQEHYAEIKAWYNGYKFGNTFVYCPWDVINHCDNLCADSDAIPENYWANTSGNGLVRRLLDQATSQTKKEIEQLIAGGTVVKPVRQELTYSELDDSIENLWSLLFITGYLTQCRRMDGKTYELKIPNREIRELFVDQIEQWFSNAIQNDAPKLDAFCDAFPAGDAATIESLLNDYLWNTISVRDTAVAKERKENFYHGILLGLLRHKEKWLVLSNAESGEGYSDILIEVPESKIGVVIELKYAEADKLEDGCAEALSQIDEKQYNAHLQSDGMQTIVKYGIACFRKHCKVVRG
jgi:hypothetical protein